MSRCRINQEHNNKDHCNSKNKEASEPKCKPNDIHQILNLIFPLYRTKRAVHTKKQCKEIIVWLRSWMIYSIHCDVENPCLIRPQGTKVRKETVADFFKTVNSTTNMQTYSRFTVNSMAIWCRNARTVGKREKERWEEFESYLHSDVEEL